MDNRSLEPLEVPDEMAAAVRFLEQRLQSMTASGLLSNDDQLPNNMRSFIAQIAHDQVTRRVPLTRQRRAAFLFALSSGLTVAAAAALAGVARRTLYDFRERDPEFGREWEDALEASLAPIEARLEEIALTGDKSCMATVRAAEALLRVRHPQQRNHIRTHTLPANESGVVHQLVWHNTLPTPD